MNQYPQLVNEDCINALKALPDGCSTLVIADPPYNLGKTFGGWTEPRDVSIWLPWCEQWLQECHRVLAENGNIFVYGIHHFQCYLQCAMYDLGLKYRRQIIWHYENGFAGYGDKTLAAHYESLLWFSKTDNYIYHPIREPYKSTERLKHKITKRGKVWTPHPDGRLAGDVWAFPTLAGRRFAKERVEHPTQKPLSLSLRIVEHFSNPADLVVIPFLGSGTECLAAASKARRYWGCEINEDYIQLAKDRLSAYSQRNHSQQTDGLQLS